MMTGRQRSKDWEGCVNVQIHSRNHTDTDKWTISLLPSLSLLLNIPFSLSTSNKVKGCHRRVSEWCILNSG